ncbi:MAG: pilin, partial [Candidatus Nealsonbacteria bacterium]|nr:pilin [Candidatus Nealsonbacteria bacterium]
MKYSKINIFFIAILLLIFACPLISMAQSSSSAIPAPQLEIDYPSLEPFATNPPTTPIGPNVLPNYIVYVFGFIIVVSAITAVVMIAIGGVEYIYSAGSPEKMKSGVSKITSSVLGLIILGCSFLILKTINPNLVKIDEPYVAPFVSEFNYGVWACKARIDFTYLRNEGSSLKSILKTSTGKNTGLQRRVKDYNTDIQFMNSNCYNVKTAGSAQKEYERKISFMYLVPEEGKREFGAVIYDDNTAKSRARVMWSNKDPLYVISEWPILDKKVASIRPFVLINSPPTDLYANLYQLPNKNRGAPEAKKVLCSTKGNTRAW